MKSGRLSKIVIAKRFNLNCKFNGSDPSNTNVDSSSKGLNCANLNTIFTGYDLNKTG